MMDRRGEVSDWVTLGINKKGVRLNEDYIYLRKNMFSMQKVWDSIRRSDKLGGRCSEDR